MPGLKKAIQKRLAGLLRFNQGDVQPDNSEDDPVDKKATYKSVS